MPFDSTIGMYDFGYLPPNFGGDVQVFFSDNNAQGSQKWVKRRGMTMCYMVCIGSGGGGGGGLTGATTTARGGGGGGAGSGVAKMLIPAIFLPDVLSIQVGKGGAGGGSTVAGGAGVNSIISHGVGVGAIGALPNIILQSNNAVPGGGGAGTGAAAGSAGTVPTISTAAISGSAISHGVPAFLVGVVGLAGGVHTGAAGGASNNNWSVIGIGSGAGGAGVNNINTGFAGGLSGITAVFDFADGSLPTTTSAGGVAGASGTGPAGNGNAGVQLWKPFYMTGGSGGGSSDANTGGNGGNGGIGCGGGGGGAGTTGGTGGNGGNGIVVIISW